MMKQLVKSSITELRNANRNEF